MAQTADGLWAAGTTGREMPRQNGKGEEIEVVEFWGITQRGERILHTIHDAVLLAAETQQRMLSLLDHPDLRDRKELVWTGTGQQMIRLSDRCDDDGNVLSRGGTIWYRTRTKGGARGVDNADRVVVDEAQHATDQHIQAVSSVLTVNANPQMNAMGTSGLVEESFWWWELRRRALTDDPGDFGYVGHTAERVYLDGDRVVQEPVDVDDRSLWFAANPALCAGRGTGERFFAEERKRLGAAGFAQEHLGVWAPYPGQDGGFLPFQTWLELEIEPPDASRSPSYGLSVAPDMSAGAVSSAARLPDGDLYVDVVEAGEGTDWIVPRVVELQGRKREPIRVNPAAVEGSFIRALVDAGVEVVEVSAREYQQSCGEVLDGVKNHALRHQRHGRLDRAVQSAQRREVGKEGAWVWAEPLSGVDLSPLKAATLALAGVTSRRRQPRIHAYDPDWTPEEVDA